MASSKARSVDQEAMDDLAIQSHRSAPPGSRTPKNAGQCVLPGVCLEERLKPIAHSLGAGVALRRLRPYINSRISSPRVSLSIT